MNPTHARPWFRSASAWGLAANAGWFAFAWSRGFSPLAPRAEDLLRFGANHGPSVASGEWWRPATCLFLHAGIAHLALNLVAIRLLGPSLERRIGARRWIALFLLSGIVSSCASLAWHPSAVSTGASGAIFGLMGAFLVHLRARREEYAGPERVRAIIVLVGLVIVNAVAGAIVPDVDQAAHVGGFAAGVVAAWAWLPRGGRGTEPGSARLDRETRGRPRARALTALIVTAIAAAAWRVTSDPRCAAEAAYLRARAAAEDGDWQRVLEQTSAAIAREPEDPAYFALRAEAARHENHPEDALRDLDRAIELDPEDVRTRLARARLRYARLEERAALADLDRARALAPDDTEIPGLRAHVLYSLREFERAARDFETWAVDEPDRFADARLYRALCRLHLGAQSALAELRADAADPRCGVDQAWLALAARYLAGELAEAEFVECMSKTGSRAGLDLRLRAWFLAGERALTADSRAAAERCFEKGTSLLSVNTLDRTDYLHAARWRLHLLSPGAGR